MTSGKSEDITKESSRACRKKLNGAENSCVEIADKSSFTSNDCLWAHLVPQISQVPVFCSSISHITVIAVEVTQEMLPTVGSDFSSKNAQGQEKSSGIKISLKAIASFIPKGPRGRQDAPSTIVENCSWQKQNWSSQMRAREMCKGSRSQYLNF